MKEVVVTQKNTKTVKSVSSSLYYGVRGSSDKGFVARLGYNTKEYRIFAARGITYGNGWLDINHRNLSDCLNDFLSLGPSHKVFEFETPEELFRWLAE